MQLADGSRVEHAADEPLEILAVTPERIELRMTRGRAHFEVTPNRARSFLTHAGDYTIRVVGTAYTVDMGAAAVEVDVAHGEVEVRRNDNGALWRVRGGERWRSGEAPRTAAAAGRVPAQLGAGGSAGPATTNRSAARSGPTTLQGVSASPSSSAPGHAEPASVGPAAEQTAAARRAAASALQAAQVSPAARQVEDPTSARWAQAAAARGELDRSSDTGRVAEHLAAERRAELPASDVTSGAARRAAGVRAERGHDSAARSAVESPSVEPDGSGAGVRVAAVSGKRERGMAERHASDASPPAPAGEAAQLFQRALAARGKGELAECERLLSELLRRFPRDSRAGLAAFQLGRVRLDLGDARGALTALDRAVRDLGTFEEQIEARRIEALERVGERAACQKARDAFLRAYPYGSFSGVVRQRCP